MNETITATVQLPLDELLRALAACPLHVSRYRDMVEKYGEVCNKVTAAKIIGCNVSTIGEMLKDGRISAACEGTRVDVRSLVDYIERREEIDRRTRFNKRYGNTYRIV